MPTIDSTEVIRLLIENDGFYPGDEHIPQGPVVRITAYTNAWGNRTYGIVYEAEARMGLLDKYQQETEYIRNPEIIWERKT